MNQDWVVYATVAVLSVGAGIAIAGFPSDEGTDLTIVAPPTSEAPVVDTSTVAPVETPPSPETTLPPETTLAPTTEPAPTSTTTSETTTTVAELIDRGDLDVVVANGANIGGLAGRTAAELEALGYVSVGSTDGEDIVIESVVYFTDGLEAEAERLAIDLGLESTDTAPIITAPPILGDFPDVQLLVYLGADQG